MLTGWQTVNKKNYYFDQDGKQHYGFLKLSDGTYFLSRVDGTKRTGYFSIDYDYYYFDSTGKMQTGIQTVKGKKYFFNSNGKQDNGLQKWNGHYYFFSRVNNEMRTGLFQIDYVLHYFKEDGTAYNGIYTKGKDKYYFDSKGAIKNGFQKVDGKTYFFSRVDFRMRFGWVFVDGYKYYLDKTTGEVHTGIYRVDGIDYKFDSAGRLQTGWLESDGKTYYLNAYGEKVVDWQWIEGEKCFFNSLGVLIKKNAKYIIDVSTHQGKIDWDKVKNADMIDGVILRIGYGSYYEDGQVAANIKALKRLNIPYGVYLFSYAENKSEALQESKNMLNIIKKYDMKPTLGVYYDIESWELSNASSSNITTAKYDEIITTFVNNMHNSGYKDTYVYTDLNHIRNILSTNMRKYIRWVAQYNHYCNYDGEYFMWQYSSSERIPGISTNVDGNVWFK